MGDRTNVILLEIEHPSRFERPDDVAEEVMLGVIEEREHAACALAAVDPAVDKVAYQGQLSR